MASISEALKIEEGWMKNTLEFLLEIWDDHETVSDIMEITAAHVRESEFGDLKKCDLSIYEKKLVLLGFMIANQRSFSSLDEIGQFLEAFRAKKGNI